MGAGHHWVGHVGGGAQGYLIDAMWKQLSEDQVRTLLTRMLDEKIMKKEHMIKTMQHKLETYRMARQMLEKR
ncbi:MAG: hypothetical protein QMD46_13135 [Methanomicrobiales archaeon]|nr:hypothetical protein [Methanomicrobiales archaeon]MDI6877639.1 hypothetical protein [Methanomicrobiales archaeon]